MKALIILLSFVVVALCGDYVVGNYAKKFNIEKSQLPSKKELSEMDNYELEIILAEIEFYKAMIVYEYERNYDELSNSERQANDYYLQLSLGILDSDSIVVTYFIDYLE